MTDYQKAVAEHMATAPEELRTYVCEQMRDGKHWQGGNPIKFAFFWDERRTKGGDFWYAVFNKKWQEAMATEFWQNGQANEQEANEPKPEAYDFINPPHYQKFSVEVIDMMVAIWGKEATALHCEMCAFKYRLRMGEKPEQPVERDLEKVNWYLNKAKELRG